MKKMKKIIIVFTALVIVVLLSGCSGCGKNSNKNLINDAQTLTKIVYDSTTNQKSEVNQKISQYKLSNDFYYKGFKIYDSFGFTANLDFSMTPYLDNYVIGEDVSVIIALLEFTDSTYDKNTLLQKMIIFEYQNQIFGFMSTSAQNLDDRNGYDFNCGYSGIQNRKINYNFGSYMILTKNAIVKYYEKGDNIYDFNYNEDFDGNINFSGETSLAFETQPAHHDISIKENSYIELNKGIVIDLINLCYVEKVELIAIITGFDEYNRTIFVENEEYPTLESVKYRFSIISSDDFISIQDLKIGDEIKIYFYLRYSGYKPINIIVDNVYVI